MASGPQDGEFGGFSGGWALPPRVPDPPAAPDPEGVRPWRAAGVVLLNLSGLGIGYALMRRWVGFVVCLIATGILLLVALPVDADGVSGGLVVAYLVFLGLVAVHSGYRGLRSPLAWPRQAPLAVLLGLVLLAGPAGGVVWYGGAQDDATEQMLLDRLDKADQLVKTAKGKSFDKAKPDYSKALGIYRDLDRNHRGSKAAKRVPSRMKGYYEAVGAPYAQKEYCDAVSPLEYLRTVPATIGRRLVGSLASWPDDRLADSLYACGVDGLGTGSGVAADKGDLGKLLTEFPTSDAAGKVEPAVSSRITKAIKALGGGDPCSAKERLSELSDQASALPGGKAGIASALDKDARRADKQQANGEYACGVDEYKDGDFDTAQDTLTKFTQDYPRDKHRALAGKIAIAAEIANEEPAAGKHLPTTASGGSIPMTISNDSPDSVRILYTGPVTGSFTLKGCGSCTTYTSDAIAQFSACKDSGTNYPKRTIDLPAGTTYVLQESSDSNASGSGVDTAKLRPGYTYTECAYVVESYTTY